MNKAKTPLNKQGPLSARPPKKPPRKVFGKEQADNIEVFCRIRPLENSTEPACVKQLNSTTVILTPLEGFQILRNGPAYKELHYSFQHVYDEETSQKTLFEHVGLPLVHDLLHGKNGLLFAYGVTSSGKTFTMNGSDENPGILPRCLDCIFCSIGDLRAKKHAFKPDRMNGFELLSKLDEVFQQQTPDFYQKQRVEQSTRGSTSDDCKIEGLEQDNSYAVFVSYVEIYNNYVYDLLEDLPVDPILGIKPPTSKQIREDGEHSMYVSGVVEVEIINSEEASDLLLKGQKRRKVAYTVLNAESSRSHSIFSIRVVQSPIRDGKRICISQLSLVDLAGSERLQRTGNAGDRLKEAGNINQSLMVLRSCIETLRENQKTGSLKMVPYRDSRLTLLFKTFFDGKGKVRMVVCINPKASDYDETVNVMKFAEVTQEVQVERAQQVNFDVALLPSRRAAKQRYASAAKENEDCEVAYRSPICSLIPSFPSLELTDANSEAMLSSLANYLKERELIRNTLLEDLSRKEVTFRTFLVEAERELSDLRQKNTQQEVELQELRKKMACLEKTNASLQQKTVAYERERSELEKEISNKSWTVLQEKLEKDRLRQDYNAKLVVNEKLFSRNIEQAKRKLKEETDAKLQSRQNKLDMLRSIMNGDSDSCGGISDTPGASSHLASAGRSRVLPINNMVSNESTPTSTFKLPRHVPASTLAYAAKFGQGGGMRTKSPPPVQPKPMIGKLKRRSRSSDCLWIDHKPDTGSFLQPHTKAAKPGTKLSERDLKDKDAAKYLLTHQNLDPNGRISTHMVKGDILKSAAGGTSVVFTDIEVVKRNSSSLSRKRHLSQDTNLKNSEDGTDLETSCQAAVEGNTKRTKFTAV